MACDNWECVLDEKIILGQSVKVKLLMNRCHTKNLCSKTTLFNTFLPFDKGV